VPSIWGLTPRASVEHESERVGRDAVVDKCVDILNRRGVDSAFLYVIAGPAAGAVLDGREGGIDGYWPRTWAARALLYAWQDRAIPAVLAAATDDSWRVREMAARVVARHEVDSALEAIVRLERDENPRVRAAAARARQRLTQGEA
jgi:hypothetical protein